MAVTLKTVPPTTFVMSSHDGVTIPEISAVSRGVVDDMITDLHAHGVMPLAPVHFIYHGADDSLTTRFRLTSAFPVARRVAGPEHLVMKVPRQPHAGGEDQVAGRAARVEPTQSSIRQEGKIDHSTTLS